MSRRGAGAMSASSSSISASRGWRWSLGVLDALSSVSASGDARLAGLVLIDNSVGEGTPPPAPAGNFFANLRRQRDRTVRGFVASMYATPQRPDYLDQIARDTQRMAVEDSIRLLSYPPWAWALNGAFSVVATPLANLMGHGSGITSLFLAGFACYMCAALAWPRRA